MFSLDFPILSNKKILTGHQSQDLFDNLIQYAVEQELFIGRLVGTWQNQYNVEERIRNVFRKNSSFRSRDLIFSLDTMLNTIPTEE